MICFAVIIVTYCVTVFVFLFHAQTFDLYCCPAQMIVPFVQNMVQKLVGTRCKQKNGRHIDSFLQQRNSPISSFVSPSSYIVSSSFIS